MSDATRAVALQNAVTMLGSSGDANVVLKAAAAFDAFLNAESAPQNAMATGNVPPLTNAGAPAQGKPAKPAKPAGPTKEQVTAAIKKLSTTGQLEAAKKILADHGATNMSSLAPEKYAAVLEACQNAETESDPTA